jgi:outer membrane protein TolC
MAREAYRQRALQYEQSVLQALEDVEQALTTISTLRLQGEHYTRYVEHNASIASLQEALYRRGMSNYLDVITTQQTWYASQQQFVQIAMQQYQAIANLVLALGDGWQE